MNLYYITYDTDDGDNFDLFVWAGGAEEARRLWLQHWDFFHESPTPTSIFLIPTDRPLDPRVIDWSDILPT